MRFPIYPVKNQHMSTDEGLSRAGAAVVARREERGLSQLALARMAGVDPKTLRALETGARWPQGKNRAAIEQALGWRVRALEDLRAGRIPKEAAHNPHSTEGVISQVIRDLQLTSDPATLRQLRKAVEERAIEELPERIAHLSSASKARVNDLVTQLEDEEYAATIGQLPPEQQQRLRTEEARIEAEVFGEGYDLAARYGEKGVPDYLAPGEGPQVGPDDEDHLP